MTENIKQIGLFMIVAQTFMHFAAGKQYEKYMKIIAGIIVLLLFVRPFSTSDEDFASRWQKEMARLTDQIESHNDRWQNTMTESEYGSEDTALRQLAEEIRRKLNAEKTSDEYDVTDVRIKWGQRTDQTLVVDRIRIALRTACDGETPEERVVVDPVMIEEVQIGTQENAGAQRPKAERQEDEAAYEGGKYSEGQENAGQPDRVEAVQEYRSMFAAILGIDEERVEVVMDGGW